MDLRHNILEDRPHGTTAIDIMIGQRDPIIGLFLVRFRGRGRLSHQIARLLIAEFFRMVLGKISREFPICFSRLREYRS